jgi:hypothetical protein
MQIEIWAYAKAPAHTGLNKAYTPERWVKTQNIIVEHPTALPPAEAFNFIAYYHSDRLKISCAGKVTRHQWDGDEWREGWHE